MQLLLALARILLGSTFATLGWEAAKAPGPRVDMATVTLDRIRAVVPLPNDDELIVRTNGAVQAVCGAALIANILPRIAAAVLSASMAPTTVAGHGFWSVEDPMQKKLQRVQFQKNVAIVGGLLMVIADPGASRNDSSAIS
jgi:putative oxidoreductase